MLRLFQELFPLFLFLGLFLEMECFNLTLLHVNDIHSRILQTNKRAGVCKQTDQDNGKCFGGIARLKKSVDDIKYSHENVIFLNGGDFYQGNIWFSLFKWEIVAKFAELLNFTAMSLGNHEFDDGNNGLVPFLKNITFPIICSNINLTNVPEMQQYIQPSVKIERSGHTIGIVGYLTTDTAEISSPENITLTDEIESVNKEAKKLKAEGVKIIIALGHSGFTIDQKIAREVPDIDVVVGGHSNTFLFTGSDYPSIEKPVGPYPTIVKQPNGKKVPVVQAYAYSKYLGYLNLTFNNNGDLISYEGKPILLSQDKPQDPTVLEQIKPYKEKIQKYQQEIVGSTDVILEANRKKETNLGNLVTDSMVHWYTKDAPEDQWTKASIGITNSGGIRAGLQKGNISFADMYGVLPYGNSIDRITIKGIFLRKTLEISAEKFSPDGENEGVGFPQVSGLKVTMDLTKPKGSRITQLKALCLKCKNPVYEDLKDDEIYSVAIPSYLANGGGTLGLDDEGKHLLSDEKIDHFYGPLDIDVFQEYLKLPKNNPIIQGIEGRIIKIKSPTSNDARSSFKILESSFYFLTQLIVIFLTF